MAEDDQTHWDARYAAASDRPAMRVPEHFADFADVFTAARNAIEIACGVGAFAVCLASNGVQVRGFDISPIAVGLATEHAISAGVADRCEFSCADFDDGLPAGEAVDLVVCNMFRDARLDEDLVARLNPGGVLAIAALSEVGATPGRFRTAPGELTTAFHDLTTLGSGEADGLAWFVGRRAE